MQDDLTYVLNYKPTVDIKHLRVILYGPVGAGKSSFVNSVASIIKGRMTISAAASAMISEESFTRKYDTHTFEKEDGSTCSFVFSDLMGLEVGDDKGILVEDIKLALMGHVKDGNRFHADCPLPKKDPGYNHNPTLDDKCHILICFISANFAQINRSLIKKTKIIRETARDLGVPQVCIATKIDDACPDTESNLKKVYRSKYLKQKMEEISAAVGFPMNCIFPVKNYSHETELDDDVDSLILHAIRRILDMGNDALKKL